MKWVSKDRDVQVELPDLITPGIWSRIKIKDETWELCWEPLLRTLFVRRHAGASEYPLKFRTATSRRFAGDTFTTVLLEFIGGLSASTQSYQCELAIAVPGLEGRTAAAGSQGESLRSPMVGKVLKVLVTEGQRIERGQELMVIEAMKMENKLFAKSSGKLAALHATPGQQVAVGQLLALIKAE